VPPAAYPRVGEYNIKTGL